MTTVRVVVALVVAMAAALATARSNLDKLLLLVNMDDEEFSACSLASAGIWIPLDVSENDVVRGGNSSTTVKGVRKVAGSPLFRARTLTSRSNSCERA